jgi:hypothetical protein
MVCLMPSRLSVIADFAHEPGRGIPRAHHHAKPPRGCASERVRGPPTCIDLCRIARRGTRSWRIPQRHPHELRARSRATRKLCYCIAPSSLDWTFLIGDCEALQEHRMEWTVVGIVVEGVGAHGDGCSERHGEFAIRNRLHLHSHTHLTRSFSHRHVLLLYMVHHQPNLALQCLANHPAAAQYLINRTIPQMTTQ